MKYSYTRIYTELYTKKYKITEVFLYEIVIDENHHFWRAAVDVAVERLSGTRWDWLANRIDDFSREATIYMISRLECWANNAKGSMAKSLHSTKSLIKWLFNRWISIVKNLFDPRYSFYVGQTYIEKYEDYKGGMYV